MKAILFKSPGDADQLMLGEVPTPEPGPKEILVKVHATSLNRADILQRQGRYPPPPGASTLLGLDMAGVVERLGPGCSRWKPGDRVFGLLAGGGYAEAAAIHESIAMKIPDRFSFEEAAAVPEVFLTAFQALFWHGEAGAGRTVLIHAGASGVGTAAIQLAREAGAKVIVTAGSDQKLEACRALGAVEAINYKVGPFAAKVMAATQDQGVDLVLDFIGAPYWEQHMEVLKADGRLIVIATMGGGVVEKADLRALMKKRLRVIATALRSRSADYKTRLTREFAEFALPRFDFGRLKPVIDRVVPWTAVADAHRALESNQTIGKIVLQIR